LLLEIEEVEMKVREIMTKNPATCTPDASLNEVAQLMIEHDCGCIPVVDGKDSMKPVGTITDRDITVRAFGANKNPLELKASDVMTSDVASVRPGSSIEQCCDEMESKQIRRILVVDESGRLAGIVAQADVAEYNTPRSGELVREISESNDSFDTSRFNTQQRNFSTGYNQQNRNRERQMRNDYSQHKNSGKSGFFGGLLPILFGVGTLIAIGYSLKQQGESNRSALRRPTYNPPLNTKNTDDKISSDFMSPASTTSTRTTEDTFTGTTTSSDRSDDLGNNMSYGATGGNR
jgi:CBS domain-containing protein